MANIKTDGIKAAVLVVALLSLATVPALAKDGSSGDDSVSNKTTVTASSSNSGSAEHATVTATSKTETETEHAVETETSDDSSAELHKRGSSVIDDLRKTHKSAKTTAERQKTCESHKQGLTNKFSRMVSNSEKIQAHIDEVFTKGQAFKVSSGLSPADYDTLVATAVTAQTNSQASIATLKTVQPAVDCNSETVASDVATFRAAAQQTRDNLKAYRTSVRAVLKTLLTAKADASTTANTTNTDNGGTQ